MTELNRTELHRDLGRMEGRLDGMDDRLSKIETIVERIDDRLANLEARDNERKGAWWVLIAIATAVGSAAGDILTHLWK